MDQRRFDSLARSLALPHTRRGILGTLAAVGAGLLGLRAADAEVTQAQCGNVVCGSDPGKCKPGCVCCAYGNGNSRCRPPSGCTGGGVVVTPTTTPAPTTTTTSTTTTTLAPTSTTTTTTTTAGPCPTGDYELLRGECFETCNVLALCGPECGFCLGGVEGSSNKLCLARTTTSCRSNTDCLAGQVCHYESGLCHAAC